MCSEHCTKTTPSLQTFSIESRLVIAQQLHAEIYTGWYRTQL